MTKINLSLAALEDDRTYFSQVLWQSHLTSQRMRERIARDDMAIVDETPVLPKYIAEPKKKLTTVEKIMYCYRFVAP